MTYGGKSTVRDRSSGTSSSVAFTPLQVHRHTFKVKIPVTAPPIWIILNMDTTNGRRLGQPSHTPTACFCNCTSGTKHTCFTLVFPHSFMSSRFLLMNDRFGFVKLTVCTLHCVRGWRLWIHRLQRRRWPRPIRNISPTCPSSWRSSERKMTKCEAACQTQESTYFNIRGQIYTSTANLYCHTPTL